jgi:hypothetical protein
MIAVPLRMLGVYIVRLHRFRHGGGGIDELKPDAISVAIKNT